MNWIINRFREASSWRGLIILSGIFGYAIKPEMQEYIITIGTSAIALIEIIRKEANNGTVTTGEVGIRTTGEGQTITSPELTAEQRQAMGLDN